MNAGTQNLIDEYTALDTFLGSWADALPTVTTARETRDTLQTLRAKADGLNWFDLRERADMRRENARVVVGILENPDFDRAQWLKYSRPLRWPASDINFKLALPEAPTLVLDYFYNVWVARVGFTTRCKAIKAELGRRHKNAKKSA